MYVVAKEDPQARTVGGWAVVLVHNFKRFSAISPLLVCIEHLTNIHLKMGKMIAFDDAPYIQ